MLCSTSTSTMHRLLLLKYWHYLFSYYQLFHEISQSKKISSKNLLVKTMYPSLVPYQNLYEPFGQNQSSLKRRKLGMSKPSIKQKTSLSHVVQHKHKHTMHRLLLLKCCHHLFSYYQLSLELPQSKK